MFQYMKPLRVSTESSQPILSGSDFEAIFHQADELVEVHRTFMCSLEPLVQDWNETKCIGEAFKPIVSLHTPFLDDRLFSGARYLIKDEGGGFSSRLQGPQRFPNEYFLKYTIIVRKILGGFRDIGRFRVKLS